MKSIAMRCVHCVDGKHNILIGIGEIIARYPMCCGDFMEPVDKSEWTRIRKAIAKADVELREVGLSVEDITSDAAFRTRWW